MEDFTVEDKTFEIAQWPQPGWRPLDPGTGDEAGKLSSSIICLRVLTKLGNSQAGTTEGDFQVKWQACGYRHQHLWEFNVEGDAFLPCGLKVLCFRLALDSRHNRFCPFPASCLHFPSTLQGDFFYGLNLGCH